MTHHGLRTLLGYISNALRRDLTGDGERVNIDYTSPHCNPQSFDMYQMSHYRRYEYACIHLNQSMLVGDFACGTGYGSAMMSQVVRHVYACDINASVVRVLRRRYRGFANITFISDDILNLAGLPPLHAIVSFETIEHFPESSLNRLWRTYNRLLHPDGRLIISTPYKQAENDQSRKHHKVFEIDEDKVTQWLTRAGFDLEVFCYQNYQSHHPVPKLEEKDFIVCLSRKVHHLNAQ